jgi:choline dehydrogenase-like flavoprotein
VKNYTGKSQLIKAKYFIVACCAIQGARLLLASNKQAPAGLGNENDLVGRFFMEHMELDLAELHVRKPDLFKLYFKSAWQIRAELAPTPKVQEENQILNGIISFMPLSKAGELPPYIKSWTSNDPRENDRKIAELHSKIKESRWARYFKSNKFRSLLAVMRLEQAPNPLSRVTLDTEKDELGVPRAQLNWAFTSFEKKTLLKIYEVLAAQAGKNDIGRVRLKEELRNWSDPAMPASTSGGWHHMGTTRMSADPRKGVVDANCKLHSLANLYVAGSACFPNGAAVNPTLTIVALSIRLADHLKNQLT